MAILKKYGLYGSRITLKSLRHSTGRADAMSRGDAAGAMMSSH